VIKKSHINFALQSMNFDCSLFESKLQIRLLSGTQSDSKFERLFSTCT